MFIALNSRISSLTGIKEKHSPSLPFMEETEVPEAKLRNYFSLIFILIGVSPNLAHFNSVVVFTPTLWRGKLRHRIDSPHSTQLRSHRVKSQPWFPIQNPGSWKEGPVENTGSLL